MLVQWFVDMWRMYWPTILGIAILWVAIFIALFIIFHL